MKSEVIDAIRMLAKEKEIPEEFAPPCNERSQYTDDQVDDNLTVFNAEFFDFFNHPRYSSIIYLGRPLISS